jgi:hypothetical protein
MKILNCFNFKFPWHISIFKFPSSGMANFFQISKSFFQFFPFPSSGMANFFKIQISKTSFFFKFS